MGAMDSMYKDPEDYRTWYEANREHKATVDSAWYEANRERKIVASRASRTRDARAGQMPQPPKKGQP
jgi:hypothetical protein